MRRICFVGISAAGKTTLARQIAEDLDLTHIELDGLFHQPNWEPAPKEQFQADLRAAMAEADATTDGWTMCGNYVTVADNIGQEAADTIVWMDLPRSTVMWRVTRRTFRRLATRQELWNGNREQWRNLFRLDGHNMLWWVWSKFDAYQVKCQSAIDEGRWDHCDVHRLRSPAEVANFRSRVTKGHHTTNEAADN